MKVISDPPRSRVETCRLGAVARVQAGGTPNRSTPQYWNGTIPWLTTSAINFNEVTSADEFITDEGLASSSAKLFPPGTILMAMYGQGATRARVAKLGFAAAFNQACAGIIVDETRADRDFVYYALEAVHEHIRYVGHGGNQKNLNAHLIRSLRIPCPPLGEQRRIAEILGAWDDAIEKVQALIQAKQKLKRALMHQLLTPTRRFPQFNGQWRKCKLRDQFERVQRQVGAEEVQALSITATVGFVDQAGKFSRVIAGAQLEKYTLLERGEFAYNKGNSNAYPQGCIYRLDEFDRGAVPHVYFSFRLANDQAHSDFYKFYFEGGGLNHQLSRVINAGVRNDGLLNLNAEDFFGVSIPVPPPDEQAHIAGVLATLTKQIAALQKQANALTTQKRGLMQKLLTGQVRVSAG